MRVLENNSDFEKTCPKCKSKLLVNRGDIRFLEDFHHPDCSCSCGACGATIYLHSSDMPQGMYSSIARENGAD